MKVTIHSVNRPNINNRIYPTAVLKKAIEKYTNEFIKKVKHLFVKQNLTSTFCGFN